MNATMTLVLGVWLIAARQAETNLTGWRQTDPAGAARPVVRHSSVFIGRPVDEVYGFISNAENYLGKWVTGPTGIVPYAGGEWIADAPFGKVKLRLAERNPFGILDYDITLESGASTHHVMRVIPNGNGSEVIRTLVREPGMTDQEFEEDVLWAEKDLNAFKQLLER